MKRYLCYCIAFALIAAPGNTLRARDKTVLDYYGMLKPEYLHNLKFSFYRRDGAWKARSPMTEEEIEPVIDIKNGYLSVTDPGTGGGTYFQEAALFTARNGTIVIGVNKRLFNGVGFEYDIRFYRFTGKEFTPDDTVLSPPPASLFFEPGADISAVAKLVLIGYELPRRGTTVRARIDLIHVDRLNSSEDIPPDKKKLYAAVLRKKVYDTVEYDWDPNSGGFIIGKKIRTSPAGR